MLVPAGILTAWTRFLPSGSTILRLLFAVAAVVATIATYLSVTDSGNTTTSGRGYFLGLLVANLIIILILSFALGSRVFGLVQENRATGGGARLRLRIIALCGLAAMIPTLVAAMLGVLINRSIESWFSDRVYAVVENAAEAAGAAQGALISDTVKSLQEVVSDLDDVTVQEAFVSAPDQFRDFLGLEADLRQLAAIVS
jgi:two-component system nitrogen regulation sensor histidine kinase NtrY